MSARISTLCAVAAFSLQATSQPQAYPTSATAELGEITLRNGLTLRGELELTRDGIAVRNEAGVARYPRAVVVGIEALAEPASPDADYAWRFLLLAADDLAGHAQLAADLRAASRPDLLARQARYVLELDPRHAEAARWLAEARESLQAAQSPPSAATRPLAPDEGATAGSQPAAPDTDRDAQAASRPAPLDGLPPPDEAAEESKGQVMAAPPLLAPEQIQRVKLHEFPLSGPVGRVVVRFRRGRDEPPIERLVLPHMRKHERYQADWERVMARGAEAEKLRVILECGFGPIEERVEIRGDTAPMQVFRQRILPRVLNGCARSGCHGGARSEVFRFPAGGRGSDAFAYTSFVLLDRLQTASGPMFDRQRPGQSALALYMLADQEDAPNPHPELAGRPFRPPLRGPADPQYEELLDWIGSLRRPNVAYALDYPWPPWAPSQSPASAEPASQPGAP